MDTAVSVLSRLAEAAGIERRYWDIHGTLHEASPDTLRALLAAFGHAAGTDAEAEESLKALSEEDWRRFLPEVWIAYEGETDEMPLRLPMEGVESFRWILNLEEGESFSGECKVAGMPVETTGAFGERKMGLRRLLLPQLPNGYHKFSIECSAGNETATLIVAPKQCFLPSLFEKERCLGISAQLYALKSMGDWGIGDFSALKALAQLAGKEGVATLGLNPLHALFLDTPDDASPYCPASRLFKNPLYLDVTAVPGFAESEKAKALAAAPDVAAAIEAAKSAKLVDYKKVAAAKLPVLAALFEEFLADKKSKRAKSFRAFAAAAGHDLEKFALFQTLSEHFGTHDISRWPAGIQSAETPLAADYRDHFAGRIAFFCYLQWLCEEQFAAAAEAASAAGMGIGLYNDLAISVNAASADCWSNPGLFATGLRVGSPPDPFNEAGQEWGVVPMRPAELKRTAFSHYIALLRAGMRHAGALRIDHVMGMQRQFLIPAGAKPAEGAYVRFPLEDFLAVTALESQRNNSLVIGEDLGTVPEGFRERMAKAQVLSCKVFYFEQDDGGPRKPEGYPPLAAVSVSTHDLSTLRGFLDGSDLDVRATAGMFATPGEEAAARATRTREKRELMFVLRQAGLLPPKVDPDNPGQGWTPAMAEAVQVYLAHAASKLFLVQLDDLLGVEGQANLPGTTRQHPNWRRRDPMTVEEIAADATAMDMLRAIVAARKA